MATRIFLGLLGLVGLLFAARAIAPAGSLEWLDHLMLAGYVSVLVAHKIGIPGLLEHDGFCGWGLCAPTTAGVAFAIVFWLGVLALVSWGSARLLSRHDRRNA